MADREYRDVTLLNYVRALLDEPQDFPDEEILRMFLENKIGTEFVTDDVAPRLKRLINEMLSDKLQ